MVTLEKNGVFLVNGKVIKDYSADKNEAKKGTIAYSILKSHNKSDNMDKLNIKFDALVSHDITYVGIIQTARASGLEEFPVPMR